MEGYVGLDAHASSCTLGVMTPSGKRVGSHVVETNARCLIEAVRQIPQPRHICLEEGTLSEWLYEILSPHAEQVVVAAVSESRGPKDDRRDAFGLAEGLRLGAIKRKVYAAGSAGTAPFNDPLRMGLSAMRQLPRGRSIGYLLIHLPVTLLTIACTQASVEDSNHESAPLPEIRLSEQLRIDGREADLVAIGAVAPHPSGNVAFAQQQDGAVLLADADGRGVGKFGRGGEGPGEFGVLSGVGWLGDTLWVWDSRLRRVTLMEVNNGPSVPRTVPVSATVPTLDVPGLAVSASDHPAPEFHVSSVEGILPDGSLHVVLRPRRGGPNETAFDTLATHARALPGGEITGVVAQYRDPPLDVMIRSPDEVHAVGVRWPLRPVFGVAPGGRWLVVAQPVLGEPPDWTLSVSRFDLEGNGVTEANLPLRAVAIPRAEAQEAIDRMIESAERFSPDLARRVRREAQPAQIYPPLREVLVSDDGWALVGLSNQSGDHAGRHLLINPRGEFTGWVSFDSGSPRAIDSGRGVWVVERDDVGIQSLVRYLFEGSD